MRTYFAWAKRHEPWSFVIDFGVFALSIVFVFLLSKALLGLWGGILLAALAAACPIALWVFAKRKRRLG
jgi:hypothetical protein